MVLSDDEKRERKKIRSKKYREENKEYFKEKLKKYREENKEKEKKYKKKYRETPQGKKSRTLSNWRQTGLICEDYDSLYCHYLNAETCDNCNILFGERGDGTATFKCMDHSHKTGEFRNFLCCRCNIIRGE